VLEAVEVAQDDRRSRLGWVLLELEQRRVTLAVRHLQQAVDRFPEV
jgi:hypothetical protein